MDPQSKFQTDYNLQDLLSAAISQIKSQEFEEALETLRNSECILESAANSGVEADSNIILVTLQNTALCYQQLGQYEQAASYLDGCAYNSRSKNAFANSDQKHPATRKTVQKLRKARYLCRVHLQLCAVLSLINKHEAALLKAKQAYKYACLFVREAYKACLQRKKREETTELIIKRLPLLEYLFKKTSDKSIQKVSAGKVPRLDVRSVLGVHHYNDWTYTYSIGDIMKIQPLTEQELKVGSSLTAELSKDLMFEKICLLVVSFFCIGTEIKFCYQKHPFRQKEAKIWHSRAYIIAKSFLPIESTLLVHVKESFQRNYQKTERCKKQNKLPSRSNSRIRANSAKRLIKQKPTPSRITPKVRRPRIRQKENRTRPDFSVVQKKVSIQPSISVPSIKQSQVQISSQSSIDSDYFRQNFIITSDDLYGNNSSDEENLEYSGEKLGEIEFRPVERLNDRRDDKVASSTGGKNQF